MYSKYGDYSLKYCIVYLKLAERDLKCSHHIKTSYKELMDMLVWLWSPLHNVHV